MLAPSFTSILSQLCTRQPLDQETVEHAFDRIMSGEISSCQIAAFLVAIRVLGERETEVSAAIKAMRNHGKTITAPPGTIDVVGTGGDGVQSLNISSAAALLTAACGVHVAKHGNRGASSRFGSSDVMRGLGINIDVTPEQAETLLQQQGFVFLFAPTYHPAMRFVAEARKSLGVPTLFNVLGPLVNPAQIRRALIGCYDRSLMEIMAKSLSTMKMEKVWLVHGGLISDEAGLDELTTFGENTILEVEGSNVTSFTLRAKDYGFSPPNLSPHERIPAELKGGDVQSNAEAIRNVFDGEKNLFRDHVVFNAGAALYISGRCSDLAKGIALAENTLDTSASQWLQTLCNQQLGVT